MHQELQEAHEAQPPAPAIRELWLLASCSKRTSIRSLKPPTGGHLLEQPPGAHSSGRRGGLLGLLGPADQDTGQLVWPCPAASCPPGGSLCWPGESGL